MWKFQYFSATQIFREIKVGESGALKIAILPHSEALNFDFYEILHFVKAEIDQKNHNWKSPTLQKMAF